MRGRGRVITHILTALTAFMMMVMPLHAGQFDRLWSALRLDETIAIVREEAQDHAIDAAIDLTGRPADSAWKRTVAAIYDQDKMAQKVRVEMGRALQGKDMLPILTYYESDAGRQVIDLELSARRAYLSQGVDEAAREAWNWGAQDSPRAELIRRIVSDADLIERNVTGSLNSNFAFLMAFAETAPDAAVFVDEKEILHEVMQDEDVVRLDTTEWLYGYLSLAYAPLSEQALQELVDMSDSPEGRALNAALYDGFDPMFVDLARALGHAAGLAQYQTDL